MSVSFTEFLTALDAKPSGEQYMACCPAHADTTPSLSIGERNGVVLVHCFANCDQADVLDALSRRELWPVQSDQAKARQARIEQVAAASGVSPGLLKFNLHVIEAPSDGAVIPFLASRGLDHADLADVQEHPNAWHKPSNSWWPAMCAAVRDVDDRLHTIHRTFLAIDPPGKAPVKPERMLYPSPPVAGCAIHLAPAAPTLLLGEGIETTASAMRLFNLPGWSGISSVFLPHVRLPELVREVVIAADNDAPGMRAALAAARRYRREGRQVRIVRPQGLNKDFNDVLLNQGSVQ